MAACFPRAAFSAEPASHRTRGRVLEGDVTWDGQFNLRSRRHSAPDAEPAADFLCPFAHPRQSPVALATRLQHVGVDTASIVAHEYLHLLGGILYLEVD